MGLFDLFTTIQDKKIKDLLATKPQYLMHTSTKKQNKIFSIKPSMNNNKNKPMVFATDDEKLAILYTLYPFYYFEFGNKEIGAIILGKHHNLLNIDKTTGYIYSVDSTSFTPDVDEQGNFNHEWFSSTDVAIRKDAEPRKITFEDVLKSGIQVFWVSDRATMLAIDKETSGIVNGDQKLEFLINQANWTPGKFMYINAYKQICPAIQTEKGWTVSKVSDKQENKQQNRETKQTSQLNNILPSSPNEYKPIYQMPNNNTQSQKTLNTYNNYRR